MGVLKHPKHPSAYATDYCTLYISFPHLICKLVAGERQDPQTTPIISVLLVQLH